MSTFIKKVGMVTIITKLTFITLKKKKDKRIFYALGTKDFEKAKAKQQELDLQHSKKIYERKVILLQMENTELSI